MGPVASVPYEASDSAWIDVQRLGKNALPKSTLEPLSKQVLLDQTV